MEQQKNHPRLNSLKRKKKQTKVKERRSLNKDQLSNRKSLNKKSPKRFSLMFQEYMKIAGI
jgi:hypothetical protein